MTIACPDYLEIVCILAEATLRFSAEILNQKLWQAQYLVKLECESCCSVHCNWRVIHFLGCLWPTIPFPPVDDKLCCRTTRQWPIIPLMLRHSTIQLSLPGQPYKAPASCPQMAPVVSASMVGLKWNLGILQCSRVQRSYFPAGDDEKGWQRSIMRTCLSVWDIFQG